MKTHKAFTIVELLIVIVVIAILAAITIVAYNGITANAKDSALKSDLATTAKKVGLVQAEQGSYPTTKPSDLPDYIQYSQTNAGQGFCATASKEGRAFNITQEGTIQQGECPPPPAVAMQTITTATCPETRTMVVDARDNRTYWIQKMPDNKCWMLTNLAYAGGGINTYSDVTPTGDGTGGTLNNGTSDSSISYTLAKYYIHEAASPTTDPVQPSTDTTGGGSGAGRQYGYHYTWCAAMGAQTGTSACANTATPLPNTTVSICPAGWRLPTGGTGGEFQSLTTAIGATNNTAGSEALRSSVLAQQGGIWYEGFSNQGSAGHYWSASQGLGHTGYANVLYFSSSGIAPASYGNGIKAFGASVRCIAN